MSGRVRIVVLDESPARIDPSRRIKEVGDSRSTFEKLEEMPLGHILVDADERVAPAGGITQNESRR